MSGSSPLYFILTCDTEDKSSAPNMIECDFGQYGCCGVNYIMDTLEERDFRGVFFVNIYEHATYPPYMQAYMPRLLQRIHRRGHEVGLHAHSSLDASLDFYRRVLHSYSRPEIDHIIKYGVDYIRNAIGEAPVSFRGGSYDCSEDIFEVIAENGLLLDSSCNYCARDTAQQGLSHYRSLAMPTYIGRLLQIPIVPVVNNLGGMRKLDINWLDLPEMIAAVEQLKQLGPNMVCQAMFHSFSFMDQKGDGNRAPFWISGGHTAYGPSRELMERFESFLDYLANDPDIEVVTFKKLSS